jgi:hypothetical protein
MASEYYSSAKNGPLALCHGRSLIGEFACASDVAPLDLALLSLLRPHCYPSQSLTHTTRVAIYRSHCKEDFQSSLLEPLVPLGCLPGSPDCYHLAQKCFSFLLATPVSMAEARMGLADCMSKKTIFINNFILQD